MTVSDELNRLADVCSRPPVTLGGLVGRMSAREHAVLTLFLGVCFMHPVPMPGLSMVLGVIIAIAGTRIALGLGPWVPQRWEGRRLPGAVLAKVLTKAASLARRVEPAAAAPAVWMESPPVRVSIGAMTALCGILILMPFPPPTNFPPAIALILLSAATLRGRPVLLALSVAAVLANVAFFGALTAGAGVAALRILR
ncbi:MAG: exopolysaccharide biosynthesis protein [Elusimicrobia bacterium]|nr:exopolysaccharide biosynthesis protein [Elusimicrobiota bacterium]